MQLDQVDKNVIDVPGLMAHIDSDLAVLKELVEIFDSYYPDQIGQLEQAIQSGDHSEVREIAHQFKGAISNFYGSYAVTIAKEIESAGREARIDDAKEHFPKLESEVNRLVDNLKKLAEQA